MTHTRTRPTRRPRTSIASLLLTASLAGAGVAPATAGDGPAFAWTRYGTGHAFDLRIADLEGDGSSEVVVGGRGISILDDDTPETGLARWTSKWTDELENPFRGGDYDFVDEMETADLNGDGVLDIVAAVSTALEAVDGATGETLWRIVDEDLSGYERGASRVAVGDFDGQGGADVAYAALIGDGIRAVRGSDGSPLWYHPRSGAVLDMLAHDVNVDGFEDIVLVGGADGGFEVHAISGLGMGVGGLALPLWVQKFPGDVPEGPSGNFIFLGGDPTVVAVGDIHPGGAPEVIVGGAGADTGVLAGDTGSVLDIWSFDGEVTDLETLDLDGEPGEEIVLANGRDHGSRTRTVEAYAGDGTPLWTATMPGAPKDLAQADLDGDGEPEIYAGGAGGYVAAIDPSAKPAPDGSISALWEQDLRATTEHVAAGEVFGVPTVVAGNDEGGGVVAMAPDGSPLWSYRTGGRIEGVDVADLDGDGTLEVLESSGDSQVAVHDHEGTTRWVQPLPWLQLMGPVVGGDFAPSDGAEVVVGAFGGRLYAYTADGDPLWSAETSAFLAELVVTDLEGDGQNELLSSTTAAKVVRWDAAGQPVWESNPLGGLGVSLAFVDANGDGVRDVAAGTNLIFPPIHTAVFDGTTGEDLWRVEVPNPVTFASSTGDPTHGIAFGDRGGRVFVQEPASGSTRWEVSFPSEVLSGRFVPDLTGDGTPDILVGLGSGDVTVISGVDGGEIWRTALDPVDSPSTLVLAKGPDGARIVVGARTSDIRYRSNIHVLDLATGAHEGAIPTQAGTLELVAGDLDGDGAEEAVAGAGWQIHTVTP